MCEYCAGRERFPYSGEMHHGTHANGDKFVVSCRAEPIRRSLPSPSPGGKTT
jgi:hypothetical protein